MSSSSLPTPINAELQLQPVPPHSQESHHDGSIHNASAQYSDDTPETAVDARQKWNSSRTNVLRLSAVFWAFLVQGSNDAAYGAIIPYLESDYQLNYTIVSLVFFSPFGGYLTAAILNNWVHHTFGHRGIAFLGPISHLIAYVGIACHPPYPVLVVFFLFAGFANALQGAAWNAWVGGLANPNEILGLLHGVYGTGAVLSPLVATSLITKGGWEWYMFYYLMIGAAAIEAATSIFSFWSASGAEFRSASSSSSGSGGLFKQTLSLRVCWIAAIFLLGYVGVEVALGGWLVVFMIRERSGEAFDSGMVATGFWVGITVGRMVLGFVTPRIGEKNAVTMYVPAAIGLQLLFWLVPQFAVSAVAVALEGFFLGPLFPAVVVTTTKLLPVRLHVSAIGFAAALGGGGSALFPFAVGMLAQAKGVQVLQPIIVALLAAILAVWLMLPRIKKRSEADDVEGGRAASGVVTWRKNLGTYVERGRRTCTKLLKVR
ncbi:MFS transporter [Neofusicoccum parvum]|uniref:MFS transporter n=1 Tax=Neofusicoccum parvum TaxID=310453 RepID=A0ACB5SDJ4_9PEZI|nr:MFS transporter [Neofusicoccum parvum]